MNDRTRGMTLLELLLSIAVFAAIVAVAYPAFIGANNTVATSTTRDQMERKGDMLLDEVNQFLRSGRVVAVADAPNPPAVTVVRVRRDVAIEDLAGNGGAPWGADQETLRFRPVRTLDEADLNEDLNGDGDRNDRFALGRLEIEDATRLRSLSDTGLVMLGLPDYEGDLDGDGLPDPLFVVTARSVDIRLRLLTRDTQGRFLKTALQSTLRLRNPQE